MKNPTHFYVVVPLGLEELCAQELEVIGITGLRVQRGAVTFTGSMLMHSVLASIAARPAAF